MRADQTAPLMTTAAVAAAAGCSAQQVRDLEALGVIAVAARSPNGYRRFSADHVRDLRAYRDLARAVGPVEARRAMREIRLQPRHRASALVCGLHTRLEAEREQALSARRALALIDDEATTDAEPVEDDSMTITELSQALGVRASTLRFWEQAGLVAPERVTTRTGTARRYTVTAIREARVTAALRAGGYRIPDVQRAITAIRDLADTSDSVAALDARLDGIARRMLVLLHAGSVLADIIDSAPAT
ncbi:MerR family transcriptional regulator [Nocardioides renjunii]|uniref:MerR family transcriptional regulator n=1 Tax=Nocardioides renjunii TaxID=3095075 RepID=UPI002AFEB10A|nr:MerR family transcriptional regulator [Nocardioides sp. S-34]WQQ22931.1 MerR family transcriptional regulator [Nocardioides sp. S-34]